MPPLPAVTSRIGPGAVTQLAAVLQEQAGNAPLRRLFEAAGIDRYLDSMPADMVEETEVRSLHRALRQEFGIACARSLSRAAGRRTAPHLLANRLPRSAQAMLRLMPRAVASRLLLRAIEHNAWTLTGSGSFVARHGEPIRLAIIGNPLCRDQRLQTAACDFYAGTFEAMFRALVDRQATVREVSCESRGHAACIFEVASMR